MSGLPRLSYGEVMQQDSVHVPSGIFLRVSVQRRPAKNGHSQLRDLLRSKVLLASE